MQLQPSVEERAELIHDLTGSAVHQQALPDLGLRGVDAHVQGRQPVFDDPLRVLLLEVGQGGEIAVAEGEPVVVIADVEHVPQPVRESVHEAEIAAVGAPANSLWRALAATPNEALR